MPCYTSSRNRAAWVFHWSPFLLGVLEKNGILLFGLLCARLWSIPSCLLISLLCWAGWVHSAQHITIVWLLTLSEIDSTSINFTLWVVIRIKVEIENIALWSFTLFWWHTSGLHEVYTKICWCMYESDDTLWNAVCLHL